MPVTPDDLYASLPYLEAYTRHTDLRVAEDPHHAIGGLWEQMGEHQFRFLVDNGLTPDSTLLDIGCGTLRGGRHFIRHLRPCRYTGFELSPAALDYAHSLVEAEGLSDKKPRLVLNKDKNLRFAEFAGETFTHILAQSVFSHLPASDIEECLANVGKLMTPESQFFFTFFEANEPEVYRFKNFRHPFALFEGLAERYGLNLDRRPEYNHPRKQVMVCATKAL